MQFSINKVLHLVQKKQLYKHTLVDNKRKRYGGSKRPKVELLLLCPGKGNYIEINRSISLKTYEINPSLLSTSVVSARGLCLTIGITVSDKCNSTRQNTKNYKNGQKCKKHGLWGKSEQNDI